MVICPLGRGMSIARLLARIQRHCRKANIAETTFGRHAVNDGKLVRRLKAGRSITLATLRRVEAALASAPAVGPRPRAAGAGLPTRPSPGGEGGAGVPPRGRSRREEGAR